MAPKKQVAPVVDEVAIAEAEAAAAAAAQALAELTKVVQKSFFVDSTSSHGGQLYAGDCCRSGPGSTYQRSGVGKQIFTAKDPRGNNVIVGSYEGGWEQGLMEGHGVFRWPDGSSYVGPFRAGELHGPKGKYEWPDGTTYDGSWVHGQMTGNGCLEWSRRSSSGANSASHAGGGGDREDMDPDDAEREQDPDYKAAKASSATWTGRFYRNYFQQKDGRWVSVCAEQAQKERRVLLEGDASSIIVRRCSPSHTSALAELLIGIHEDGLVPLILGDTSLGPQSVSRILEAAVKISLLDVASCAHLKLKRRDYARRCLEALQEALRQSKWLAIAFDHMEEIPTVANHTGETVSSDAIVGQPAPESWRLGTLFDESVLPPEVFAPLLFNGRMGFIPFLPMQTDEATPLPTPAATMDAVKNYSVYHLKPLIVSLAKVPAGLKDAHVRNLAISRLGRHAPLHRSQLVLVTETLVEP